MNKNLKVSVRSPWVRFWNFDSSKGESIFSAPIEAKQCLNHQSDELSKKKDHHRYTHLNFPNWIQPCPIPTESKEYGPHRGLLSNSEENWGNVYPAEVLKWGNRFLIVFLSYHPKLDLISGFSGNLWVFSDDGKPLYQILIPADLDSDQLGLGVMGIHVIENQASMKSNVWVHTDSFVKHTILTLNPEILFHSEKIVPPLR